MITTLPLPEISYKIIARYIFIDALYKRKKLFLDEYIEKFRKKNVIYFVLIIFSRIDNGYFVISD